VARRQRRNGGCIGKSASDIKIRRNKRGVARRTRRARHAPRCCANIFALRVAWPHLLAARLPARTRAIPRCCTLPRCRLRVLPSPHKRTCAHSLRSFTSINQILPVTSPL
jgi:hypothetical protein